MAKPTLPATAVGAFLGRLLGGQPDSLEGISEGLESQAFRFTAGAEAFALRINPSIRGFEKDRWASTTLSPEVPVPRVVDLGWVDPAHAYCIAEWAPGTMLEELSAAEAAVVADAVLAVWEAIAGSDVSSVQGVGDFGPDGNAPGRYWREVLTTELGSASELLSPAPQAAPLLQSCAELLDRCPEERALVHGDFGSNNVLVDGGRITAVLDWEGAMIGDPLWDVANTRFWATYLDCMQPQAEHFDRSLSGLPGYRERVRCYALLIGLREAGQSLAGGDSHLVAWALARCAELAESGS